MSQEFVDTLREVDGVTSVEVRTTVTVSHRRRNTGEVDDSFQEIRERVVPEETFDEIASEYGFSHSGVVDVVGDFTLKNRFYNRDVHESDDP